MSDATFAKASACIYVNDKHDSTAREMMAVYIVTWDLNKEGAAYNDASTKLHARLDTLTTIKDRGLDSVRFVSTDKSAQDLYSYVVRGILDTNDKVVVSRMTSGEYWGVLSKDVWPWIADRL